ncbi:arsenate reductase family protein [Alloscardovia omnicolens]|uniref:arsenate reductase family protein n=1 Tax=Alloscardovia omnicolens TaxID=419015 RepID=UPI003A778B95
MTIAASDFPLTVLCHPRCSTCKKALAWLDDHQIPYTWRNIIEQNPTAQELNAWTDESNLSIRRFFNTSGMAYRSAHVKEQLDEWENTLSAEDVRSHAVELLATDGMLCKRPLVVDAQGHFILVGFKQSEWEAALI